MGLIIVDISKIQIFSSPCPFFVLLLIFFWILSFWYVHERFVLQILLKNRVHANRKRRGMPMVLSRNTAISLRIVSTEFSSELYRLVGLRILLNLLILSSAPLKLSRPTVSPFRVTWMRSRSSFKSSLNPQ